MSTDVSPGGQGKPDPETPGRRSLLGASALVGGMTMLSRAAGLTRDVAIAAVFGAGGAADAFFLAFRIPNLFRRLFAEGAFSAGFVPVLSEYRIRRSPAEVRDLIAHVLGALGGLLVILTLIGIAAAPLLVRAIAPGFAVDDPRSALTVDLLRLTFPYLLFISLVALAAGVQNNYGRFGVPAFTPVLLNVCLITAVGFSASASPAIMALGWGVVAAGLAQLLLQLPALARIDMLVWPRFSLRHEGLRRVALLMAPAMLGASTAQINLFIDTLLASFLVDGSISWLYYADRLMELPVGLVAVALSTVVLPSLSASHAQSDPVRFAATLDWGVRWALLLAMPASVALGILATPLIATIFNHGAMQANDVNQASFALLAFAVGVPALVLVKVLVPGYFGRHDTRTPVRISIIAVAVNISLNLLLISWLAHVGLALATAVAGIVNALLLARGLLRLGVWQPQSSWWRFGGALLAANGAMAAWLLALSGSPLWWIDASFVQRIGWLSVLVVSGMVVYGVVALLSGIRPGDLKNVNE